ncbi:LysR family transcriptional regulator [Pollutimonas nitritireducens]|uniref:LysR family transcriptional regulator n=1 Tax=Pollutimonas nitritireducens TaxID=2045209 RepID=A0A2N4UF86_9BURK|nr:LysR substrate-binding domain-containing protein [Pollutimonas nitritireducens]PLC53670.1 LysR family transcriptional regulator [Pollutimonas nitritireducens]
MSGITLLAALKAFDATARASSITTAARQLGLRQPTVSAHILRLEAEYGVELFFRKGRRLVLTEFGDALLEHTRRIFSAEDDARSMLTAAKTHYSGTLNLHAIGPYNVTPIIKAYRMRYPGVQVTVTVGDSKSITQRILDYQGDIGLVLNEITDPQIFCMPYREQALVIFSATSHELADADELNLADLTNQEFVMREEGSGTRKAFEDFLKSNRIKIKTSVEMRSREAVREAVIQGLGLGVVADRAYLPGPGLVKLNVRNFDARTYTRLICRAERKNSPLIAQFLRMAQQLI